MATRARLTDMPCLETVVPVHSSPRPCPECNGSGTKIHWPDGVEKTPFNFHTLHCFPCDGTGCADPDAAHLESRRWMRGRGFAPPVHLVDPLSVESSGGRRGDPAGC